MCLNKTKLIQTSIPGGHYSYTRNLEVIALARDNRVDIICLPPNNSRKMQHLDNAFMGPLKTFYPQDIVK